MEGCWQKLLPSCLLKECRLFNYHQMKALLVSLLAAGSVLSSCVITRAPGFHSGYERLTSAQQEGIRFVPAGQPIPGATSRLIYAVEAQSLLRALRDHDTTMVYMWGPRCHSSNCASLQSVQSICDKKGYRLYVVAQYYDMEQINLQPLIEKPLLTVDHRFYKSNYCDKYTRLFTDDLRQGKQLPDSLKYARYYLFGKGHFVRAANALADAQSQFPFRAPETLRKPK